MSRNVRLALLIGLPTVILLPVLFFAFDTAMSSGEVERNVSVAGVELGGLGREDAVAAIRAHEARLRSQPALFSVNGREFSLDPTRVGFNVDVEAVVASAMEQRRDGNVIGKFFGWFGSFSDRIELDLPTSIDVDALDEILVTWESEAIENPAHNGGILVKNGRVLPDYPREGQMVDRASASPTVLGVLSAADRPLTELRLAVSRPVLTDEDVDAAVAEANLLIDESVTFTSSDPEVEVTFTPEDLAMALDSTIVVNSPPKIELAFDQDEIASFLAPYRDQIEQPPVDATWDVDVATDTVTLLPSRPETLLDPELVAESLYAAALQGETSVEFPFGTGRPPAFTTEEAEAMGPLGLVSKFTTEHPAGQPRVTNIHLIADTIDGVVVAPGAEFSINEYVGERTTEKGYVPAPMILAGEIVDDVGGGVSQFATTFYNAVFYGCYEDIDHKPHSYYFTRYPEVSEATISWPTPNLVFRNDSDAPVIIKTQYTSTSITVKFFGNNGGRTCARRLGERYAITDPPVQYKANAAVPPTEERVVDKGAQGWTNSVTRVMSFPDGSTKEQQWVWTYSPQIRLVEVHPCNMPNATEECPVKVPSVVGLTFDAASARLTEAGFTIARGEDVEVGEDQNGLVQTQNPGAGVYLPSGTAITVTVGVYVPPEEPPPAP